MTDLGKAYVQIIPSAKGISGEIQNAIGGDVDKAGVQAGTAFSNKFGSIVKTAIAALGIGKVIGDAISQGGELEQSLGGVETLFKENADTVKQYAAEAYKSTGMSANAYMQNVTGFSASLLQSLGGDTGKAAEAANMAMIDMSDNANKMGTSMESITTAYAGFAKQNYTMLDNLKLGYGGTKTEMERLLADATALTGVQYDITNLSDVYEAIHVVQTELGITGTTALEASTTMQGSFSAMQAAWQNLLGNIATGGNVSVALQALTNTVSTYLFSNFMPMLSSILSEVPGVIVGVIQGISDHADEIIDTGVELVMDLIVGIINSVPDIIEAAFTLVESVVSTVESIDWIGLGSKLLEAIRTGIGNISPNLLTDMGNLVIRIIEGLANSLPQFLQKGSEFILKMINGIINNMPQILGSISTVVANIIGTIAKNLPQFLQKGIEIIAQLVVGLIQAIPKVVGAIPKVISAAVKAFKQFDWISLGTNIINGVVQGIRNAGYLIGETLKGFANSAWQSVKSFFGISSPSKLMRDTIGRYIPEGMAVGIEQNTDYVTDAMNDMANAALDLPIEQNMSLNPLASTAPTASGNSTYMGGVTINISAADYANAREIGEEIEDILINRIQRQEEVFA